MKNRPFKLPIAIVFLSSVLLVSGQGLTLVRIPVVITGEVVMANGSLLPEPVRVELICRERVVTSSTVGRELAPTATPETAGKVMREEVLASATGDFSFHFEVRRQVDVRFQYALQQVDLTGCELFASLPGFRSDIIYLGIRRRGDNPDVGAIVLHSLEQPEAYTVSLKSLKAPANARKSYGKAQQELRKPKPDFSKAVEKLNDAVRIDPGFAAAWQLLGEVRLTLRDRVAAKQAFERAMAADPEYILPCLALAGVELSESRWQRVADLSKRALELNANVVKAQYFQAVASFFLEDLDTAEKWALKVRESAEASIYPITYYVLGAIGAQGGDIAAAAAEFRRFLELKPEARVADQVRAQLRQWERRGLVKASKDSAEISH